jgi:hypothetical protein
MNAQKTKRESQQISIIQSFSVPHIESSRVIRFLCYQLSIGTGYEEWESDDVHQPSDSAQTQSAEVDETKTRPTQIEVMGSEQPE